VKEVAYDFSISAAELLYMCCIIFVFRKSTDQVL